MRKLLVIPLLLFALSIGFSSPARATTPTEGTGTYANSNITPISSSQAGGNTFVSLSFTQVLTDSILMGSCSGIATEVLHADGTANATGSETCTGTVAGQQGVFNSSFVLTQAANGFVEGQFVLSGTGSLGNLHGHGTAQGSVLSGTNTVAVHLDP